MISINEMASKLRNNVILNIPDDCIIANELMHGFLAADIRYGVNAFASLLLKFFDIIIASADNSISPVENSVNSRGHTNIYADLKNPLALFYCIGLYGKFGDNNDCLLIDGNEINRAYKKMRGNKPNEYMRLLQDSGLTFSVNIAARSFNLNKVGIIEVRHPSDKLALIGLKLMAEAVSRVDENIIYVFARCDYRILSLPKKYGFDICDVTNFLHVDERNFFIDLHNFLISNECKNESKNTMNEYIFSYTSKLKKVKVFSICISMDGSYVKLNSKLICEQPDLLSDAPESIKDAVTRGQNCAKKNDSNACNPKCVGKNLLFSLDGTEYLKCRILNFNLPIANNDEREYIKKWLERELA